MYSDSVKSRRTWIMTRVAALTAGALPGQRVWAQTTAPNRDTPVRTRLSLNENAFGCSPRVAAALRSRLDHLNRYTEQEAEALTSQIATQEGVSADQVILGDVLAALGTHLSLAGGAGGEFIYSTPGFTDLVASAERAGGIAVGIPLNNRLQNDLPAIAGRLNGRTRAVYLVNPHNPSGTVTASETLKPFVREISQRALVVIDEAYLEYTDDFNARTFAPFVRDGGNLVVFRTFGKMYGLASLGFGYALVPTTLAHTLRQQGVGAAHSLNALAVVAASAALGDTQFVNDTRAKVAAERARWHTALERLELRHSEAQGSFVFFHADRPQKTLAAAFLTKGIDIGRDFPPLADWARITIGLPAENTLAMDVLRQILREPNRSA
jgi:histidinol-phosphate aminotransferase